MPKCTWTGEEIPFGTGKMYVKKDGKVLWFSNKRAEKNFLKLKRNPRNFGYTESAQIAKKQHLAELQHEKADAKESEETKKAPAKKTAKKTVKKTTKKAPAKEAKK